jgi:formamidopyrimidine-DNA glycosylase
MPELPDVTIYLEALAPRVVGARLETIRLASLFLVRTVDPPLERAAGKAVTGLRRLGKRLVFVLEDDLFLVLHLMIAGRLRWEPKGARIPGRLGLAAFDFSTGTLLLTEAGTQKRAALHLVQGEAELGALDPGGLEVLTADLEAFRRTLTRENHTLKRALTDPHLFSGIGNAYSDEILHRARLSPLALTGKLAPGDIERLYHAVRGTLETWIEALRREAGAGFPLHVTAFRPDMAVHGRYRLPCPVCGSPVQRIVYAGNECNYCAPCQTGGKLLADRAWSRLLKADWPRRLEDLEDHPLARLREPAPAPRSKSSRRPPRKR